LNLLKVRGSKKHKIMAEFEVVPMLGTLTGASVTCGEFPAVGNQRIITPGGHLNVDVRWTQDGVLWAILPLGTQWKVEAVFEQIGGAEEGANPSFQEPHVLVPHNHYFTRLHVTTGAGADQLNTGAIYKVYAKITLTVAGNVIACGFGECDETVHIMDVP
jgi:hypothetical protein